MSLEIIRFRSGDNVETVLYRMQQTTESHVLLVMPPNGQGVLAEQVDMAMVKKMAHTMGFKVGVVSIDNRVRAAGRMLNVPVYWLTWSGRRRLLRERSWLLPHQSARPGRPTQLKKKEREAAQWRVARWPRWLRIINRYLVIMMFCFTLAILAIATYYAVPSATIILKPKMQALHVSQVVTADPNYNEENPEEGTVPGRLLVMVEQWQASVETTAYADVPSAPARGTVTFVNRLPQPISIPAGTRVSTSTGERIMFQTVVDADVPAQIGGEVDVQVMAVESGEQGNLPADRINRIEGPLAIQLNVRNLWPMGGGMVRYARTVNFKDKERLRTHVVETLIQRAIAMMEAELEEDEFLALDTVELVYIYEENYSHFVGEETDALLLEMKVEIHGTAVNEELSFDLVYGELDRAIPQGYVLIKDSIRPTLGTVVSEEDGGRVSIELIGDAFVEANLELADPIDKITGQDIPVARGYLNDNLVLRAVPEVVIWPESFGRIPYLTARIYTKIDHENWQP